MDRALRSFWGLAAIGGAIAVGITTQNAGYIVITFLGGLIVPHALGLMPPRHRHGRFGHGGHLDRGTGTGPCAGGGHRAHFREMAEEWHRQAHAAPPASPPTPAA